MKKMSKKYKHMREQKSNEAEGTRFLKGMLGSSLFTLAAGGILLLLSSLLLTFLPDPLAFVLPAGLICAALTAFIGGFLATRVYHLPILSSGLALGILLTALSLLFSLLFTKNASLYATGYSAAVSALLHALIVGLTVGGAFFGAREKAPAKKRRRKRG